MPAPLADIVSALSAEETCTVCCESYPAVDQNLCESCGAALCPECSRLRPDAKWTCASCERRAPTRVFGLLRPPGARESSGSHLLNMIALKSDARLGSLQTLKTRSGLAAGRFAHVVAALVGLFALLARPLALAWQRAEPRLQAHFARVKLSFNRDAQALGAALYELVASAQARVRVILAERVLAIRNIPVREHAMAFLLSTAILVAVSRSSRNPR